MKRFLFSLTIIVMVVAAIAVPTFAEEINYRDYVTHVDVDGDNDLVTVTIPGEWCEGQIVYGGGTELREWLGPSVSWDFRASAIMKSIQCAHWVAFHNKLAPQPRFAVRSRHGSSFRLCPAGSSERAPPPHDPAGRQLSNNKENTSPAPIGAGV